MDTTDFSKCLLPHMCCGRGAPFRVPSLLILLALLVGPEPVMAATFTYEPPGQLVPGSGAGRQDHYVYLPDMRFPLEHAPAYVNSQVWGVGGVKGPKGDQCDVRNYTYPWRDNFCETRRWNMPLCPAGQGHQGVDIRPSGCEKNIHSVVAVEDGIIRNIGIYPVFHLGDSGMMHRYVKKIQVMEYIHAVGI